MKNKTITIIVVARNEETHLVHLLNDITEQNYPHALINIILVDSASEDRTRKIMEEYKEKSGFDNVLVLDNPKKILAYGWNLAIQNSTTDLIVRIDAHASIPVDFITKNVKVIEGGERVSGGARPNVLAPTDKNKWQELLLDAEASIFGSSIAPYRNSKEKKYVKSIFHGVYERNIFSEVGLLNTKLGRTEDNDIHYRMRNAGIKLSYNPEIISYQYVRSNLKKMIKQKYSNGYWIGLTVGVQPKCFSVYHFIPLLFVISILVSLMLYSVTSLFFNMQLIAYTFVMSLIMIKMIVEKRSVRYLLLPFVLFLLHIAYGLGTLLGLTVLPFKIKELSN